MTAARCVVGWRVVLPRADGKVGRSKPLSRAFTIKTAAQRCLELAWKDGHEAATLETVYGLDAAGPSMSTAA